MELKVKHRGILRWNRYEFLGEVIKKTWNSSWNRNEKIKTKKRITDVARGTGICYEGDDVPEWKINLKKKKKKFGRYIYNLNKKKTTKKKSKY